MRVCVTDRPVPSPLDLRLAGELAPSLALPWIVKLRYGVLAGLITLSLLTHFLLGVALPIRWLAIPLVLMAVSNLGARSFAHRFGDRRSLGYLLLLDTVCLTAFLALTGGPANPLSLLYLVQITLSAVILNKGWTWSLGALSVASFGFLFWMHVRVSIFEQHPTAEGFSTHLVGMWIAFVAAALLVSVFIGKVSEALRRREQEVLQLQGRIARHERLASAATLAAGAAHELGTPLATIAIASRDLELHATEVSRDPEVAADARLIRSEVERCRGILQQMSARGAEQPGELPVRVELEGYLETVRNGLPAQARERIRTTFVGDTTSVVLPAEGTRQVLLALVSNAIEASEDVRPVRLSAERKATALEFSIEDSGRGMDAETLNRVAEPFFTTKRTGNGLGLGTFLARVFAERLGGRLVFESEVGKGTRALLELPLIRDDG